MIKMKNLKILSIVCISFLLFSENRCNIPDTISTSVEFILPPDSGAIYKFVNRYFLLEPGDTALFYGARHCTTSVNGLITSNINDSAYLRIITLEDSIIRIDDSLRIVYPQQYQQSSTFATINENTITRFLEKSDSAILQVAYEDNGILFYPEKERQIVIPTLLEIGPYAQFVNDSTEVSIFNTWPASPLIKSPLASSYESIKLHGYTVATETIATPSSFVDVYVINGVEYKNGALIISYFTLSGEVIEDGKIISIIGNIKIKRNYFWNIGLVDQLTVTSIQKIFSDGSIERIRETVYVARGPEGAGKYIPKE